MLIEQLQKEFITEKKFEGVREVTLENYHYFFNNFNQWLEEQNIEHLEDLNKRLVKQYFIHCSEELNNRPVSINDKLKHMRTFSKWLVSEGLTDELLTEGIKAQKEDYKPRRVETEDIRLVLKHLRREKRREHSFTARRNHTLIIFLLSTGIRLGELERLEWNNIDFHDYLIRIEYSKSRKAQSVPLSEDLARELLDWKLYLEKHFKQLPSALFVTKEGKPFSRNGVQNVFKRLKKNLGLSSQFSPHTMRNYFLTSLLKNGSNLREVQLLARHSKISVTQRYLSYNNHELKEGLDKNNPLNNLY